MNIFTRIAIVVLLGTINIVFAASTSWSPKFNRDFITGQFYVYPSIFTGASKTYYNLIITNIFASTIQSPLVVYYTTSRINAHTYSVRYPYNLSKTNIQYQLQPYDLSKSYLKTLLTGFLYSDHISFICYKYLIVLANNRIFGTHITIDTIDFMASTSIYTPYPSTYSSNDTITVLTMLRDLKVEYKTNDQDIDQSLFEFEVTNNLLSNQTVQSQISVPSYFDFVDSIYSIRFLLLIIDKTRLEADYRNYESYTKLDFIPLYSSTAYSNLPVDIQSPLKTYISGVSRLAYINNQQQSFIFQILTATSYDQLNINCQGYKCRLTFSYWITVYNECDGPQWINDGSICYDNCTAAQYLEFSNNSCQSCDLTCLTCYDATSCSSCNASHNRVLSNVSCIPMDGYYQSGIPEALACHSSCWICNGSSATDCMSCYNTSLLVGSTCQPCHTVYQGCDICDSTACLGCNSLYRHINQIYCNLPCADPHCQICSNSDTSFCFSCQPTPYRVLNSQGLCVAVCGDGVIIDDQQCDDGNFDDHDGCSLCIVDPNYTCTSLTSSSGNLYTAYCSYLLGLNFSLLSQQKLESSNSLRLVLTVQQYQQHFWKSFQSFDEFISLSAKHSNLTASFISQWTFDNRLLLLNNEIPLRVQGFSARQYFQIVFEYKQELHNLPLTMSFAFNRSSDPRVNTIPLFNQTFTVLPHNNQYAHLYLAQTYQHQSAVKKIIIAQCIILMVAYIIASFFRCKRIIAEAIMVFQISFAGLVTVQWANPLHSAVKSLSILLNPLNLLYSQSYRPFDDPLLPNRLRNLGLYSDLLSNLNTGLIFVVLPLLVGCALKLLSLFKCLGEQRRAKLSEYGRVWLTDFMLAGLTILGCGFGCNLALEIKYAIADLNYSGIIGVVICGIISLLLVIFIVFWLKCSNLFVEYHQILNKGPVSLIFTLLYSFYGFCIAFTSFMFFYYQHITTIMISFTVLLFLVLQFIPIYLKSRDNIRVKVNLLTIALAQSAYLIDKSFHGYSYHNTSRLFMAGTMIIPLALAFNLVINLSFMTYQLLKAVREWLVDRTKQKMETDEKNYVSEKTVEMKKLFQNSQESPLNTIKEIKFTNPLLESPDTDINNHSANLILREELNNFLEVEKLQAQRVLLELMPKPKNGASSIHLKDREKYCKKMILEEQYKELEYR